MQQFIFPVIVRNENGELWAGKVSAASRKMAHVIGLAQAYTFCTEKKIDFGRDIHINVGTAHAIGKGDE